MRGSPVLRSEGPDGDTSTAARGPEAKLCAGPRLNGDMSGPSQGWGGIWEGVQVMGEE